MSDTITNPARQATDLEKIFNRCFKDSHATVLCGGAEEPLYQPATGSNQYHTIFYSQDYFASALHEVAHWCVAGAQRREKEDYGYWYVPDGRNESQQAAFEKVEILPQALEWIFSVAAGVPFRVSADNLDGETSVSDSFKTNIAQQAQHWCDKGLSERQRIFVDALQEFYGTSDIFDRKNYLSNKL